MDWLWVRVGPFFHFDSLGPHGARFPFLVLPRDTLFLTTDILKLPNLNARFSNRWQFKRHQHSYSITRCSSTKIFTFNRICHNDNKELTKLAKVTTRPRCVLLSGLVLFSPPTNSNKRNTSTTTGSGTYVELDGPSWRSP